MTSTIDKVPARQNFSGHAYVEVGSSELTRDINRDIVLERIRALQPVSRVDLARATGLQPSTVSSIVEQLLEERWVEEGSSRKTARGRRPTMLRLNTESMMLVADLRPLRAILAVIDLNGRTLSRHVVPLGFDASQSVRAIGDAMEELRASMPDKRFIGVGLSVPGRVDIESGRIVLAPNLKWKDVDLRDALARRLGLPVEVENAANACLLSELWFGRMDGVRNAVLVTVSEGIGGGILAGGRLIVGHSGMAGEIGHVCIDPAGPVCGCGQKGCWETFASCRAALRYYQEIARTTKQITIEELVALAIDGDKNAIQAFERQAVEIGKGLRIVTATLSPEVILFAGQISAFWDLVREKIEQECFHRLLGGTPPQLISIGDGETARLRGAAAVLLQRHSGYYRATKGKALRKRKTSAKGAGARRPRISSRLRG
jgi:glucokinase-like ROK family protein